VFQLDYGYRGQHNFVLALLLLECRQQAADWLRLPFGGDQDAGIQD
jgi:hypothetical protein